MAKATELGISALEYHVLLALASGPLHGYAVKEAVVTESSGALTPRAGSLYRVLARLLTAGLVTESGSKGAGQPHPGLARRYYALSARGRAALATEARRLRGAALLAEKRLGIARSRS
jgi:PadR family transcriptional regulator